MGFAENVVLHRQSEGIGVDTLGDEKLGVKGENSEEVSVILALWRTRTAVSKKVPAVGSSNPETTNVLGPELIFRLDVVLHPVVPGSDRCVGVIDDQCQSHRAHG